MTTPPTGTVTFLFTDIEGSTTRWEHQRAAMAPALDRHNAILDRAVAAHAGHVFHTAGDAYCAAFAHAADALNAAVEAQRALALERWDEVDPGFEPLRVRMGIHTGLVELKDGDYFGRPVNRVARLMAAGHGGQILVSLATQQLVRDALPDGAKLVDLGVHRLKDLEHTEHLYRLVAPGMADVDTPPDTAEKLGAGERVAIAGAPADAACPYRGLHAFREADAPFFFGRETFTELLVESVAAAPMVGVIGPSGSGKSSVVLAGLVPRLRATNGAGNGNGNGGWTVVEMRPGSRPYHALAGAVLPLYEGPGLTETDRLAEMNKLAGYLRDGSVAPRDVLARIGDKHPDLGRLLLVADQFEELYTLCPDEAEHRAFQDLLFEAAFETNVSGGSGRTGGTGGLPLTLALTLRADFMGHALAYRPFADAIQKHDVKLGPMNREELARVVRLPAEKQGRAFETGLVERIVDDVGERAGTLPLLEFALTKLWEQQAAGWLTHEAYEAIGRVEGAVARHADGVYVRLAEPEQERARRVFVQLVQPGEGTEDTRRLATHEELLADWGLVQRLADARLVTTGRDEAGRETAEVVHEALIRSWGRLREWMSADRRFRTWQERLRFALRQWAETGHDEGALLRGVPLGEAEGWLAERGGEMTGAERDYIAAGTALRERREAEREMLRQRELAVERERAEEQRVRAEEQAAAARTLRRRAVWLAGALVVAAVAAGAALNFGRQAQQSAAATEHERALATVRELAAASSVAVTTDPDLALLLAIEAISRTGASHLPLQSASQSTLANAVEAATPSRSIASYKSVIARITFSPDGSILAAITFDRKVHLLDPNTGRELAVLQPVTTGQFAFTPDNRSIVTLGADTQSLQIWSVPSGHSIRTIQSKTGDITWFALSPDGQSVVASTGDQVAVWNTANSDLRFTVPMLKAGLPLYSPDGNRLAVNGDEQEVSVFEAQSGRLLTTVPGRFAGGRAYSRDGRYLAVADSNGDIKVLDAATLRLEQMLVAHRGQDLRPAFSPDSKLIAAGSSDGTVRVWDLATGREQYVLSGHRSGVNTPTFAPDGTELATYGYDGTARLWDLGTGALLRVLTAGSWYVICSFSPDSRSVATAGFDGTVRLWDMTPDPDALVLSHPVDVSDLVYMPDGRTVLTAANDGKVRVWDTLTGRLTKSVDTGSVQGVSDIDISADGKILAAAGDSVSLWELDTGTLLRRIEGKSVGGSGAMALSRDGGRMVTQSNDQTVVVWDVHSGERLVEIPGVASDGYSSVLSPDGQLVAAGWGQDRVRLWNASTGAVVRDLIGHSNAVAWMGFSPDGQRLVTASSDRLAMIWDVATGKRLVTLTGHLTPVTNAVFGPDGSTVATMAQDGETKIWDAQSGAELMSLPGGLSLQALAFSPDGRHLARYVGNGLVRITAFRLPDLLALAHRRVTRTFTEEECRQYLHVDACPAGR